MLTDHISDKYRPAVRFTVVGTTGTLIQYAWYWLFLMLFAWLCPERELTTLAFTIAFVLEMVSNYFLTAWYTFQSRPQWTNLGGFLTGRAVNYVIQIAALHMLLWAHLDEKIAGFLAIVIAGIINFFVVRVFFKKKPQAHEASEAEGKNADEKD